MEEKEFTVSEFIDFLNSILTPRRVVVVGEIGERVNEYPNYLYFKLLDLKEKAMLDCFIWRRDLEKSGIDLKPGTKIKILGFPKIYKPNGGFNFQVEQISFIGEGVLKKAFEALKKKLEAGGFFALERKKSIPLFCKRIGLITSKIGKGALPDFEKNLGDHGFQVYLYDVRVEGLFAIDAISEAIQWFNKNMINLDVIVLIRGGGNWESLQSFNSEKVAKAIFASNIPIICGVGHEKDITIADYVSDLRVSTPTQAAKFLSKNWENAAINIHKYEKGFSVFITNLFKNVWDRLNFFAKDFNTKIKNLLLEKKSETEELSEDFNKSKDFWQKRVRDILKQQEEKLNLSNPVLKLKQGYTMTLDKNGQIIKDLDGVKFGDLIQTKYYKGHILSQVKENKKE